MSLYNEEINWNKLIPKSAIKCDVLSKNVIYFKKIYCELLKIRNRNVNLEVIFTNVNENWLLNLLMKSSLILLTAPRDSIN